MKTRKVKIIELVSILIFYLFSTLFILAIKADYLSTIAIYTGVPSLYLSLRNSKIIWKTLIYSVFAGLPVVFITDYLAHVSNTWYEPSVLGIRILDAFPIDIAIWGFLYVYFIIAFYEYFLDKDRNKKLFSHSTKYVFYLVSFFTFIFGFLYTTNKELLIIKYFYILFIIIAFILPTLVILLKYPRLFSKVMLQAIYFFVLGIMVELTAVYLNQWSFTGEYYIGFVELMNIKFPFEEFLWLILAVPAYICIYEYFTDDRK